MGLLEFLEMHSTVLFVNSYENVTPHYLRQMMAQWM